MQENEEVKQEETSEPVKKSSSGLYLLIVVLIIVLGGVGYMVYKGSKVVAPVAEETTQTAAPAPKGPPNLKGQTFADTDMFSNAVLVYPGALTKEAQAVTTGWQVKSKTLPDGTTQVDLIPVGSEATEGDTAHTFNLAKGDKLYFVDLNPNDDDNTASSDKNKNDDMGIVVGSDGIVK